MITIIIVVIIIIIIIIIIIFKISKKTQSLLSDHKTPKINPWVYIFQRAYLLGLHSGVGGYNLVPWVSCLSDIGLRRRPISEKQETLRERLGRRELSSYHSIIYIYIYMITNLFLLPLDVDLVFLDNKKCTLNFYGLMFGEGGL